MPNINRFNMMKVPGAPDKLIINFEKQTYNIYNESPALFDKCVIEDAAKLSNILKNDFPWAVVQKAIESFNEN